MTQSFRSKVLLSALVSGLGALGVEVIFEYFFPLGNRLCSLGIGIIVFVLLFLFLLGQTLRYMKEISSGIQKMSNGILDVTIPERGRDEFTMIAIHLNMMTNKIVQIRNREREAEEGKNDLIASMAHDLRTPLTSIIGYLDLIKDKKDLDDQTKDKYIQIVYNKSKRLEELANELFGFMKFNHNQIQMDVGVINIVQLLRQLLDEFYPNMEKSHMKGECYSREDSILIRADGGLIARLFDNLISNAIKYGKEGKKINVLIQRWYDDQVKIQVINYGNPIKEKDLERIFEKFYRVDPSRSLDTGGTGLGLAIAKNIVDMHDGTIEAKSNKHETVFEVILPLNFMEHHREEKKELAN